MSVGVYGYLHDIVILMNWSVVDFLSCSFSLAANLCIQAYNIMSYNVTKTFVDLCNNKLI